MAQHITPESRAKILSAVKDDGMSVVDAAKTLSVSEKTIRKWFRSQSRNAHTSSAEVQKLRQEVFELRSIIGKMIWQQETKRKSYCLRSVALPKRTIMVSDRPVRSADQEIRMRL